MQFHFEYSELEFGTPHDSLYDSESTDSGLLSVESQFNFLRHFAVIVLTRLSVPINSKIRRLETIFPPIHRDFERITVATRGRK